MNLGKPEKQIYLALINKYNIIPKESIFIDDNEENIKTSRELGFNGIVFRDLDKVKMSVDDFINN